MEQMIRWAVMGTGRITEEFIPSLQYVRDAALYAVASRTMERANLWKEKYGFEKAYGSYEELVQDENVDVIYIATPTSCHYDNAKLCLEHGKNVLCEKAVTATPDEFHELTEIARAHNVFFMEGIWMQLHPAFRRAVEWVQSGRIGHVKYIKAELAYQHPYDGNDRIFAKRLGAGNLLDLGVYTFGLACSVLGFEPSDIHAAASFGPDGADIDSSVTLKYKEGPYATLLMGYSFSTKGVALIAGDRGKIEFTERFNEAQRVFLYDENYELSEAFDGSFGSTGFEQEIAHVNDCLRQGLKQSPIVSWAYTDAIFRIITACEKQYAEDRRALGLPE